MNSALYLLVLFPTSANATGSFLLGTVICSPQLSGRLFVGPAIDGTITELPLDLIGRLALAPEIAGTLSGGMQIKGRLEVNRKTNP
jgi:hypothetical protein